MHISEGVLSAPLLVGGWALSAPFVVCALKTLEAQKIPLVASMSALFFVGSFIHIPFGVTNIHLVLSGIIGAMIGLEAFLALLVALFLQAILFGYGGLGVLGVNLSIMALPALLARTIFLYTRLYTRRSLGYFLVGFTSILLSSILLSLVLYIEGEGFKSAALAVFALNIPLMGIEGFITCLALSFLERYRPTLLERMAR